MWILNLVHQYFLTPQGMHDIKLRCGRVFKEQRLRSSLLETTNEYQLLY